MQGRIRTLLVKAQKGVRSASKESVQVTPHGLDGDHHTGTSKRRQILLISGSLLDELDLEPGDVHENVVVDGLDVMSFREGQLLRLGEALVEVTIPCEPCGQMERVRNGLKDALKDRRGMFVKVLEPGMVRIGDSLCEASAVENLRR